jgi:hypothetical protein
MAMLQASGAEVLGLFTSAKFTAQAKRRTFDAGWKPKIITPLISAQIHGTLRPAGLARYRARRHSRVSATLRTAAGSSGIPTAS